jgi:hypothetical protein
MNRTEFNELLKEINHDIEEKGGNFQALFGGEEKTIEAAKFAAAAAVMAVDRYYTNLTRLKKNHPGI